MEFIIAYYTDQLVSYVGALKDFEYTACYYSYDLFHLDKSICKIGFCVMGGRGLWRNGFGVGQGKVGGD